jgi:hypothetical protein
MIPDRIFYPLAALAAAVLIGLAMVYPQGEGDRSPSPFGHEPTQQKAARLAALRASAQADIEARKAAETSRAKGPARAAAGADHLK